MYKTVFLKIKASANLVHREFRHYISLEYATWTEHVVSAFSVKYFFFLICVVSQTRMSGLLLRRKMLNILRALPDFFLQLYYILYLVFFENKIVKVGQKYC